MECTKAGARGVQNWRSSLVPQAPLTYRGQGIAEKMLVLAEQIACERGACKLTLEVLQGNVGAIKLYHRIGFANYQLDPAMGQAQFLQKWLPVASDLAQSH